jgi:hypothetical protein
MPETASFFNGLPKRITVADFRRYHNQSFPKLIDAQYNQLLADAIDDMYTMFHGVETLWDSLGDQVWFEKTRLAFRLLTAWHITDVYPTLSSGVASMGGVPLRRKKIGGVDIYYAESAASAPYKDYRDLLGYLKSNAFGHRAYNMIKASGKLVMLRGNRRSIA